MATFIFLGLVIIAICGGFSYLYLLAKGQRVDKDHVFLQDVIEGKTEIDENMPTPMVGSVDDTDYAADPSDSSSSSSSSKDDSSY